MKQHLRVFLFYLWVSPLGAKEPAGSGKRHPTGARTDTLSCWAGMRMGVCSLRPCACREPPPPRCPESPSRQQRPDAGSCPTPLHLSSGGMRHSPPPSTSLKEAISEAVTSHTQAYTQRTSLTGGEGAATAIKRKLEEPNGIKGAEFTPVLKRQ